MDRGQTIQSVQCFKRQTQSFNLIHVISSYQDDDHPLDPLNEVCMYKHAMILLDITSADGYLLLPSAIWTRPTNVLFPVYLALLLLPILYQIQFWKELLRRCFLPTQSTSLCFHPLGNWKSQEFPEWTRWYSPTTNFLYFNSTNGFLIWNPSTLSTQCQQLLPSMLSSPTIPADAMQANTSHNKGIICPYTQVSLILYGAHDIPDLPIPTPITLHGQIALLDKFWRNSWFTRRNSRESTV